MNGNPYKSRRWDDASARSCLQSIRRIVQLLRVASRESEKRAGLSGAQLFVLQKLREGGTQSLNELAERTLTHQSSVSVVVQRLVEQKLVARVRGERDARRVELSLTSAARSKLRQAPASVAQDRLLAGLGKMSSSDRRILARLLSDWVEATGTPFAAAPAMFFEESSGRAGNGSTRRSIVAKQSRRWEGGRDGRA